VACLKLGDLSIEYAQNARRLQRAAADGVSPSRERIGPQLLRSLTDTEPAQFEARAISVFERAVREFGTVKAFPDQTVRDIAEGRISGLKELVVGKPATALEGLDLRNNFLTLAAQRGKVVVLVFWAGWWPPSTAAAASVNELVRRFEGKPFAVMGVNGDASAAAAEQAAIREKMTWPSIFDGNNGRGPIATKWGIPIFPMIFIIDAEGIIRHIAQDTSELDKVIDVLLSKMK